MRLIQGVFFPEGSVDLRPFSKRPTLKIGAVVRCPLSDWRRRTFLLDKELLKRIKDIERLDNDTKQHLFFLIDYVIQNYKTKKAFAK